MKKMTLGQMAGHLGHLAAGGYRQALTPTLDLIGKAVKDEIQSEIGEYQPAIANFPSTAQLSPVTIDIKTRRGYGKGGNPDSPLWATGDFHDSIGYQVDKNSLSVEIGSNQEYVKYSELGTAKEPARPVMGPALLRVAPKLLPQITKAAGAGIMGGVWEGLGIEAATHVGNTQTSSLIP